MRIRSPGRGDALLVVDVQKDFLPGGALAVPEGDAVIPPLNEAIRAFAEAGLPIFATRDWHPPNHCSFVEQGGLWPLHCVAGTRGAAFPAFLRLPASTVVISKADDPASEAYSAFSGTDLAERLSDRGVRRVFAGGLATDYCVLRTVLDARAAGLDVVVLDDAARAVDVEPGDGTRAIDRMRAAGATFAATRTVLAEG
ncbi:MAG: nicotinamidase [Gemmatimonadales bacterium]|nr:nicotinamidase [Gemmatimonadales bacterium]MXX78874.1 nicotinamidase [Gemmatimonadales bacterium]MYC88795.1 nicotinamidase [Candidatus Palauibacter denitrificans]